MLNDTLIALPDHLLARVTGDRRRRLVEYMLRWGAPDAARQALEAWLAGQPQLVTLREAYARVLLELERPADALALLDELDAERGMTDGRRELRMRALAAQGQWAAAADLLPAGDEPGAWRLRAELLIGQGRHAEAASALERAAALLPPDSAPLRGLAELALARGDLDAAQAVIAQRQEHSAGQTLDTRDLRLLLAIAERRGDTGAQAAIAAQLAQRRVVEHGVICAELGVEPAAEARARPEARERPALSPPSAPEPALPAEVAHALHEHFGHQSFRPGQAAAIAGMLRGETTLAVLPTGAGKSLTYQLPALLLEGATLVISPLIALMKDQLENLPPALAERATMINSSLDSAEVARRLRGIAQGRYKLIYIAPERLRQQLFVHALKRAGVARVVVDEAHCVSLWGISFRPDYLFIRRAVDQLGAPPLLALTATATPDTATEIAAHLGQLNVIRTPIFRPNLRLEVSHVPNKEAKLSAVIAHCQALAGSIVVYVRSREGCEEIAGELRRKGVAAEHYHAQVSDRSGVQDRFMRGETRVLVATVAFGMGVDKPDIRGIIHYNLPQSIEAYYQEAGRAGRDGLPARCILLYAPSDKGQLTSWLREESISKDYLRDVYRWLRRRVAGAWGVISIDDLRRDLQEPDDARMRVALGLLERVGLLTRHFDLPRTATLLARDDAPASQAFQTLATIAGLRPGQARDVDMIDLAERHGSPPDELERQLLAWQDQGLLRYDGQARDVLIELHPASGDVGGAIDRLLAEYASRQSARVDAIAAYARGLTCRHRAIAAHFGEQQARCRDACDICRPAEAPALPAGARASTASARPAARPVPPFQIERAVLEAVRELPGQLGDKDLVCVLLGTPGYPSCAAFGQLAGADFAHVRRAIGTLIADGRLAYHHRTLIATATPRRDVAPQPLEPTILRCLAQLPFPVGKSGLAKILKGAAGSPIGPDRCSEYAALSHLTAAAIEQAIDDLIDADLLRRSGGPRPLLALTQRGADTLAENVVQ
jgi:ATP-dependent DNA helicase RecQ